MTIHLSDKKCVACEGGMPPLMNEQISAFSAQVDGWQVSKDEKSISKQFRFNDFKQALAFVDKIGALAEEEGHHPDLNLFSYKNVLVTLSTHAIGGLSENDFILAAKIATL